MRLFLPVLLALLASASLVAFAPVVGGSESAEPPQQPAVSTAPFRPAVVSGQFVYVAGTLATDAKAQRVAGDAAAQTRTVLENIKRTLEAAGSSLERVASMQVYLARASDFQAMNDVYRTYWPKDPPARTTVIANLVMPGALVEMSAVGLMPGAERTVVHPAGWVRSPNPYSYGIKSGDTLFLSGLVSRRGQDNTLVEGNMSAQTKVVLDNAGAILKEAGMTYADVASARVFITDTAAFQDMNEAYRPYFTADPPARATLTVGLTGPSFVIEITLTAVKAANRRAFTTPNADGTAGRPNPTLSSAIRAGNRLFLSGMLGASDSTKGDMAAQTRETLARLGRTLQAAGYAWTDVVDGLVAVTDVRQLAAMNEAYRSIVAQPFPARATIETGLVVPDGLVEIMLLAARDR